MLITPFSLSRLPQIHFGAGSLSRLTPCMLQHGRTALVITGRQSFIQTPHWQTLQQEWAAAGMTWHLLHVSGEPSPQWVDQAVADYRDSQIDIVVGIGGGSALDAAKAVAGLLPSGHSVMDYLEGVGKGLEYTGPATPLIAVPTTAGTGSEATKNAVLSIQGAEGFKKSFRHDALVPHTAIVDPDLLRDCPKSLIAANGMDAFTQLLESYVSSNASVLTDALAWSGMQAFCAGFWSAWETEHPQAGHPQAESGFSQLAYASMMSGITLAQAGLGSVHGLASPLGAFFPIPHGVVCGTLLAEATAINIAALQARTADSAALTKYARVGRLLADNETLSDNQALEGLVTQLRDWVDRLNLPRLHAFGMTEGDFARVVANARGGSMKTNPILLTDRELQAILSARL